MSTKKKITLSDMHKIAHQRGGKCLSKEYLRDSSNLLWECSKGHRWKATPNNIKRGTWCSKCRYKKARLGLDKMHKLAKKNNGKCLSKEYVNISTPLKWECSENHIWETTPSIVMQGCWCPKCFRKKQSYTIEDMQNIALEHNGKCISKRYSRSDKHLIWQCSVGHQWEAKPTHIIQGSWCKECNLDNRRLGIQKMKSLAVANGGLCLSKKYKSRKNKLKWKCKNNHEWEATPEQLLKGSWCPECNKEFYFSEEVCRKVFEQIFCKEFINTRPEWMKTDEGQRLELDGYCDELNLAFEYQGRQHFEIGFFGSTQEDLEHQKIRDQKKIQICKQNNVDLIVIRFDQDLNNLPQIIKEQFKILKRDEANYSFETTIDPSQAHVQITKIQKMNVLAKNKKGKCLSTIYMGNNKPLEWECSSGHRWFAIPRSISMGTWCPNCDIEKKRIGLKVMKDIALDKGGKCLSNTYINARKHLEWECAEGHKWTAPSEHVKRGSWCNVCANKKRRLGIEAMHEMAKVKKGFCLSKEYKNTKTKLHWQCEHGHKWEATPSNIRSGTWCPNCVTKI